MNDAAPEYAMVNRRRMLALLSALGPSVLPPYALSVGTAATTIPAKPSAEALSIWSRLNADLSGRPVYAYTGGTVWGLKPQSDQTTLAQFGTRLYGYHSLAVRKARPLPGGSVALKLQSWTFYADPESDEITTTLHNPYTGENVASAPMAPPALEQVYGIDGRTISKAPPGFVVEELPLENPFDMRVRHVGRQSFVSTTQFSRFRTPGINWFKLEAQMMSFACARDVLEDAAATHVPSTWSHNLVAEWQTWMKMHGTPGHILFKGEGTHVSSPEEAPAAVLNAINRQYPGALAQLRTW